MNYKQLYAIKNANREKILKVCPNCSRESGIYFLTREEEGFKWAYIGKAKHLLSRLADHLAGYQHIDLSLRKHGLWREDNQTGWKVNFLEFPEDELDTREQYFIKLYAKNGYQLRNHESGGTKGKVALETRRSSRGYYDGLEQGFKNAQKFIKNLFDKHLDVKTKSDKPNKNQEKALWKFKDFLEENNENE